MVDILKRSVRIALSFVLIVLSAMTVSPFASGFAVAGQALSPLVYGLSDWQSWASTAWQYYQPGVGVNPTTGLHRANLAWGCFSDWDLGSYIYATIYARKLNLISDGSGSGDWQFNDRISKILNFLQNRPLASGNYPYHQYTWDGSNGQICPGFSSATDSADAGRLLAALYALKNFRSSYTGTVDAIYARSESAYDAMAPSGASSYYDYLKAEGFAAWGYSVSFNGIDSYSGGFTSIYGQSIPSISTLTSVGTVTEPIIHVLLEADTLVHQPSSAFH